jgi:hypothetical protein
MVSVIDAKPWEGRYCWFNASLFTLERIHILIFFIFYFFLNLFVKNTIVKSMETPEVFISYSWKPITNKNKVIELAERLQLNGVHVILDEWDLSEGHDKYSFMEKMVNRKEVKRVLLICNKEYAEKANQKTGGVGIESLIVSDEIYNQVEQEKFIPIVFERDEKGKEYLPTFVKTRKYIDLSSQVTFEEEYENLLRNIFEKPASRRPVLGTPPPYIIEDIETTLRTAHLVTVIKNSFINEKKNTHLLINDYYETFLSALNDYRWNDEELAAFTKADETILKKIEELRPLRNDFVSFLEVISKYSTQIDLEKLHDFWKGFIEFVFEDESESHPSRSQNGYLIFEHFRFFIRELFMHQIAFFIQKQNFVAIEYLLYTPFIIYDTKYNQTKVYNYEVIRRYLESLNLRNKRLSLNRLSLMADILKERTSDSLSDFEKLKEADLLLYYISIMNVKEFSKYGGHYWYPETLISYNTKYALFEKMKSMRFFEKVKILFKVNSAQELSLKISSAETQQAAAQSHGFYIPFMQQLFQPSRIGELP